jgi:arsenical pump membrane protein
MEMAVASLILVATLVLVLVHPRGLPAALPAAVGGALVLALRLVSLSEAWDLLRLARDPLVFLVGMMIASAVVERAGFFEWCAMLAARAGGGDVRRLYLMVFLTGTIITAFLSLDATAIVLTPIVYAMAVRLKLRPLPFMFACGFIANTASLFMPISNLTNLLVYRALDLNFTRFSLIMFLPAVLAVTANALLFTYLFRLDLHGRYAPLSDVFEPENRAFFAVSVAGLTVTLGAIFVASVVHVSIGVVALAGGLVLLGASAVMGWMSLRDGVRAVSWNLIVLVVGLFLVVQAVENAGVSSRLDQVARSLASSGTFAQILGTAAATAAGSNLINNIPMTIVVSTVLRSSHFDPAAGYAALLGTNIGPNLTIAGSLATLIWLNIVQRRGITVTVGQYLRLGIVATPVIFLNAVVGLWISLHLFG